MSSKHKNFFEELQAQKSLVTYNDHSDCHPEAFDEPRESVTKKVIDSKMF
jgi:hypothetical protein